MDFGQDLLKVVEHLRHRQIAANKIRQVARHFGVSLERDFQAHNIVDLPLDLILKVVGHLMTKNCTSLDRSVEDMNIVMMPALQLWLANMPKVINLTAFLSFSPKNHKSRFFIEALTEISKTVPQVEELLCNDQDTILIMRRLADCIRIDDEVLEALGKLTQLKTLSIRETFKFRLNDLIKLGNQLPNLQNLFIALEDESVLVQSNGPDPIGEQLQKSLRNLKMLIFLAPSLKEYFSFYGYLVLHLPDVHFIDFADDKNSTNISSWINELDEAMTQDNTRPIDLSRRRKGRFFKASARNPGAPHDDRVLLIHPFPHHLKVFRIGSIKVNEPENGPESNINENDMYMLFDHITSLSLFSLPAPIAMLFLQKYGPALKTLTIVNTHSNVPPYLYPHRILNLCPRLEKLVIRGDFYRDRLLPIHFLPHLKQLQLAVSGLIFFPELTMLEAPNLEELTLVASLGMPDILVIMHLGVLIDRKKILQLLKTLRIHSNVNFFHEINFNYFRDMAWFIKNAVASLPALTKVKYDLDSLHCGYPLLAKSLRHGRLTNVEMPKITRFFQNAQLQNIPENIKKLFVDEELISILDKYV